MGPSVPYTVVFLLYSAGGAVSAPPRAQLDDLYDYGAARGVSFVPLGSSRAAGLPAYDAGLADNLEAELEQARTALSALEEEAALPRLQKVEADLLAHPHLPQAAFLMAECLSLQAQAAAGHDASHAQALRAQRAALEGPRAVAFGESSSEAPAVARTVVQIVGLATADELEVDGAWHSPAERHYELAPGLHHFRVLRGGHPVFATFSQVKADQTELTLAASKLVPCSAEDLSKVDLGLIVAGQPPPPGVTCQRWAVVRLEPGGVGVAMCGRESCGAFVHWQRRKPAAFTPLVVDRSRLPAWAGFAIAGATAAMATSLVLWQSGALDRGQRAATTLEYGGLNP